MTRPFKVESGVALVSMQEFQNFENKILEECAQVADIWADAHPHPVACSIAEKIAATIRAKKK